MAVPDANQPGGTCGGSGPDSAKGAWGGVRRERDPRSAFVTPVDPVSQRYLDLKIDPCGYAYGGSTKKRFSIFFDVEKP